MLRTILAFFGYVKVPVEAVQMSMCLEDDFKNMITICSLEGEKNSDFKKLAGCLEIRIKAIQILTEFLRSGRLLDA